MGDLVSDGLLLRLRRLLADGRAGTTAELAGALGVSDRQVRRALEALAGAGVRVVEERDGRGRRYRLDGLDLAPPPRPVPLSERELRALLAVVGDGRGLGPLAAAALAAVRKLVEAFGFDVYAFDPEDLAAQIVVARAGATSAPEVFDALAGAAQARQAVRLALGGGPGARAWRFEPYALALADGGWVVLGRAPERGAVVRVPLARVRAVEPEAAFFDPPAGFDARAALATAGPLDEPAGVAPPAPAAAAWRARVVGAPSRAGDEGVEGRAMLEAPAAARSAYVPSEGGAFRMGPGPGRRAVVFVPGAGG